MKPLQINHIFKYLSLENDHGQFGIAEDIWEFHP
jgi:hypothetical protein